MSQQSQFSDYSRYFSIRQKVFLVNMSSDRDSEVYESLSGAVTSSGVDSVDLMIAHGIHETRDAEGKNITYKLTSEALGSGIQVLADLTGVVGDNIYRFNMHGTLEMFQRRIVPRVEVAIRVFSLRGNFPHAFFKKEWKRVMDHLRNDGVLPGLNLQTTEINLSAGGIGLTVQPDQRPTPISMFFIEMGEGLPVCALTETVWERRVDEGLRCGHRFIHILKSDQERINRFISDELRASGGAHLDYKRNWVLVDKMVADVRKPG